MKSNRKINADAMLICLVFLICSVGAIKIAKASSSMQLALTTIQLVEATEGSIKHVLGNKRRHAGCEQMTQAAVNVGV